MNKKIPTFKETAFEINPAIAWYLDLAKNNPEEKKRVDDKYLSVDSPAIDLEDGKELIEYIYEQEVVIPRSSS